MAKKKNSKIKKNNFPKLETSRWKNKTEFLKGFKLKNKDLEDAGSISWEELAVIFIDHEKNKEWLRSQGGIISQFFQGSSFVNSVKFRVKESDSLIGKIIKKRKEGRDINFSNYKTEISDLVGVRVLHVLQNDWLLIHKKIMNIFNVLGKPVASIRPTDDSKLWTENYKKNGCKCEESTAGYRSVHYDVEVGFTKSKTIIEIQVRTISEEAWGELDHKINYPKPANAMIGNLIKTASMLSGVVDHFHQQIITLNNRLREGEGVREKLNEEIKQLAKENKKPQVTEKLYQLENLNSGKLNFSFDTKDSILSDFKEIKIEGAGPFNLSNSCCDKCGLYAPSLLMAGDKMTCVFCSDSTSSEGYTFFNMN